MSDFWNNQTLRLDGRIIRQYGTVGDLPTAAAQEATTLAYVQKDATWRVVSGSAWVIATFPLQTGVVSTIAEMQALSPNAFGGAVTLKADNIGGSFRWDAGNKSVQVGVDTQKGVFVPPTTDTTGASGAWVRIYDGTLNAEWFGFGATGNSPSQQNDAWVGGMQLAMTRNEPLQLPAGEYVVMGAQFTDIFYSRGGLIMRGFGKEETKIRLATSASGSLLEFSNVSADVDIQSIQLSDFTMERLSLAPSHRSILKLHNSHSTPRVTDITLERMHFDDSDNDQAGLSGIDRSRSEAHCGS